MNARTSSGGRAFGGLAMSSVRAQAAATSPLPISAATASGRQPSRQASTVPLPGAVADDTGQDGPDPRRVERAPGDAERIGHHLARDRAGRPRAARSGTRPRRLRRPVRWRRGTRRRDRRRRATPGRRRSWSRCAAMATRDRCRSDWSERHPAVPAEQRMKAATLARAIAVRSRLGCATRPTGRKREAGGHAVDPAVDGGRIRDVQEAIGERRASGPSRRRPARADWRRRRPGPLAAGADRPLDARAPRRAWPPGRRVVTWTARRGTDSRPCAACSRLAQAGGSRRTPSSVTTGRPGEVAGLAQGADDGLARDAIGFGGGMDQRRLADARITPQADGDATRPAARRTVTSAVVLTGESGRQRLGVEPRNRRRTVRQGRTGHSDRSSQPCMDPPQGLRKKARRREPPFGQAARLSAALAITYAGRGAAPTSEDVARPTVIGTDYCGTTTRRVRVAGRDRRRSMRRRPPSKHRLELRRRRADRLEQRGREQRLSVGFGPSSATSFTPSGSATGMAAAPAAPSGVGLPQGHGSS